MKYLTDLFFWQDFVRDASTSNVDKSKAEQFLRLVLMSGSRRCILQSYKEYRKSNESTLTARTLGLGVCCVLSMYGVSNAVGNELYSSPSANPQASSFCKTLREDELISTFCKTCFTSIPPKDQSEWEQKVQAAFKGLNFVSSTIVEHQDELYSCVLQVESAVREANLETKRTLTKSESSTVRVVSDILDQLTHTIAQLCPEAFAKSFLESVAHIRKICRASSNTPSINEAWHKRAQVLLTEISLSRDEMRGQEGVWDEMGEILSEAENVLQSRFFTDDEQETLAQITEVAANGAPLYPCVAACAKIWYDLNEKFTQAQEVPLNADTVSPESYEHQQVPSQSVTLWQPYTRHLSFGVATDRKSPLFGIELGTHSPGFSEHFASRKDAPLKQDWQPFGSLPPNDAGGEASTENLKVVHDDVKHKTLALVKEDVASLVATIDTALLRMRGNGRPAKLVLVRDQLRNLIASLSQLSKDPPLDTLASTVLGNLRSSLMAARAGVKSTPGLRMAKRYMARFNNVLTDISRLWQQARLANLKGLDALKPQELESLKEVTCFPKRALPMRCVASKAYVALLTTDSEDQVKPFLDDFLACFDLASKPVDLSTAELYLSILLYLKHDTVKLLKPEAREPLGKLIFRLRDEIFGAKKIEIPLRELPEFEEFYLAYFGASTWKGFDWRDSLRVNPISASDAQRPLITKLVQYGSSFCEGSNRLTELSHIEGPCEIQARLLETFRSHVLCINPPECVFADGQTLDYIEQFAAFAEKCLNECKVDGSATGRAQIRILEVTLDGLQWCRHLSSYLGVTSTSILEKAYNMTAKALILKQLWSFQQTLPMLPSERAFISQGILAALSSHKLDDELLACTKMFLDRNIPSIFVAEIFDELLIDQIEERSDHDKMMTLLAVECRIQLFRAEIASGSGIGMPTSIKDKFTEALVQARLLVKGVQILPAPGHALNASLRARFIAPNAHEVPRLLSVDVVLEEALHKKDLDHLTVSEVAHHVATYLLGNSTDEEWLDFLTSQVKWCSFTPLQLAEHPDELIILVQSLSTSFKAFWFNFRKLTFSDNRGETTPDLIRSFVYMITLKWLSDRLTRIRHCPHKPLRSLYHLVGEHITAWMPKWLTLMYDQQALFPPDVSVTPDFLEKVFKNVKHHRTLRDPAPLWSKIQLDTEDVAAQLGRLLKRVGNGTAIDQDFEFLLKRHRWPVLNGPEGNVFLTMLLWARHHKRLRVNTNVIEECIKETLNEVARPGDQGGLTVTTMQKLIKKLLGSS